MWSLGFTAAWAESCEMGTGWPWSWGLTSPLSPWSSSCLIPVCITQQGQPASHFLGHPLGLPAAGNQITSGNTQKPQSQCLKWKSCEKPSCSLRSQVIRLAELCLALIPTPCGAPSSFPRPPGHPLGRARAGGQLPSGQDGSQGPCVLSTSVLTRFPFPTLLIFIIWAGMSLCFLGSCRFDFN